MLDRYIEAEQSLGLMMDPLPELGGGAGVEGGDYPDDEWSTSKELRANIRAGLLQLDYLKDEIPPDTGRWTARLRAMTSQFQRDAGLAVTGRPNQETWDALVELTTVEGPVDMSRWFAPDSAGTPRPRWALKAAAVDRLSSYGLVTGSGSLTQSEIDDAVAAFADAAGRLELAGAVAGERAAYTLLFDHDRLLGLFALKRNKSHLPGEFKKNKFKRDPVGKHLARLALGVVRVELSLQGFADEVSGDWISYPLRSSGWLERLLQAFWEDAKPDLIDAQMAKRRMRVNRLLFVELGRRDGASDGDGLEALERYVHENRETLDRHWREQDQKPRRRVRDGLARAARWVRSRAASLPRLTKLVAGKARKIARNIRCFLVGRARAVVTAIREAIRAFGLGLAVLGGRPVLDDDQAPKAVIKGKPSLDFICVLSPDADRAQVRKMGRTLGLVSESIALASQLLQVLLGLVRAVVSPLGWLRFLARLVRAGQEILEIGARLREGLPQWMHLAGVA